MLPTMERKRATIALRKSERLGADAMLRVEKGMFNCGVQDCYILVRFDSNKAISFAVDRPSDHSYSMLFIKNRSRFIANLKKSKVTTIEAEFFQQGKKVFSFNPEGLS